MNKPLAPEDGLTAGFPGPELRLFCLAHAGGSAQHFTSWARWLPAGIRPVPLDLPGHGTRLREPLVDVWPRLIAMLTDTITSQLDGPYALVGHSLGAVAAFDVARALQERGHPPELLLAIARNGPTAGLSHRPLHDLPEEPFQSALRRLGGIPELVLREPDLMRLFLPALRVGLRFAETYARTPGPPLGCPIVAVAGRSDQMTEPAGVLAWQRETTNTFDMTVIDAGHFFLDDPTFVDTVHSHLLRLRARSPRS